MRQFAFALLMLALQLVPVSAQDQWRDFRADADGFVVSLPQEPTVTSRRIKDTKATQSMFLIEKGELAYLVSVVHMEKGTGPKNPDLKYFQNLMKNYTEGSKTTLRTSKSATIAGKPGIDGISDAGDSAHQVQIFASGDRVYMVIYVGPKGQENSADATRFRNSFKLLN
ncbi:MAG: hypothetical protein E6G97_23645 [Alphaproteobacteria bacterium]|nr:MAG: hypothetical protein E6G97_23645 [Alphaproteobacteria bacterium]